MTTLQPDISATNMQPTLHQLIYRSTYSRGRIDSPLQALRDIVKSSGRNNARLDITGYLIFDGDTFLQILEGRQSDVLATYARIADDPRHRDATTLSSHAIGQRDFARWAMGGSLKTTPIPATISGSAALVLAVDLAANETRGSSGAAEPSATPAIAAERS